MDNDRQNILQNEEEENFNILEFLTILLSNWYWIVLSVVVALSIAYVYILRTPATYTRSSELLIKNDEKSGGSGAAALSSEFENLGFLRNNANVNNEIITLQAPVLMQEVVKRLHLDVSMSVKRALHYVPVYEGRPVSILLPQADDSDVCSFKMRLKRNKTAELYDFQTVDENGELQEDEKKYVVRMNTLAHTPAGVVVIQPTADWGKNFTDEEIYVTKSTVEDVAAGYSASLSVDLNSKESTVLNVALTDQSPKRADDVILKLFEVYNEQWLKDKNRIAESTFDFITERLKSLTKELGDVDQQISDYKSSTLLPDETAVSSMYMSESAKNNDQILTLNNQLGVAKYIREYLADKSRSGQYLPTNTGIGSTGIEEMIANYNKCVSSRNQVLDNSSEATPIVQKMDNDLAQQRQTIMHSLDNLISQISSQLRNWEATEAKTNEKIATAPRQVKNLLSIGRQQKVKEQLYIYLLQKREENELSRTFTAWNTRIIQPPMGNAAPVSPKKSMAMLIAFALGIFVPAGLLFMRENLNHTVRGRADLAGMNTSLLGEIPMLRKGRFGRVSMNNTDRTVLVKPNSRDLINESFRIVRTKLDYYLSSVGGTNKVVMLTSFNANSGKTFITMNLAMVMALKNQKVIAVDLDLRKASLSKSIHSPHKGVSGYLSGFDTDFHDSIVRNGIGENVDVLPVGVIPPNPSEILQNGRLETLLSKLREEYDIIFLDCPPIDVVADASIIAKDVDVTLFVVRAGLMDRRALRDVDTLANEGTYKHMALLLNGSRYISSRYGNYRYGYSYGYGYGYGYYGGGKKRGKGFGLSNV